MTATLAMRRSYLTREIDECARIVERMTLLVRTLRAEDCPTLADRIASDLAGWERRLASYSASLAELDLAAVQQ